MTANFGKHRILEFEITSPVNLYRGRRVGRISFEDFAKIFKQLDIVHVSPDDWMTEPALHSKQPWRAVLARRRWRTGYNAGGGPSHSGEFLLASYPTYRDEAG